jgi:glycosyltransferase involved in cell wall biosynthesis
MRIGLDARLLSPQTAGGGLGRYLQELIAHLQKIDAENEYVLFLRQSNWGEAREGPRLKKILADYRWYTLEEQIKMPRKIKEAKIDLMHFPHFNVPLMNSAPFVLTIHDLILLDHPSVRATTLGPLKYKIKFVGYKLIISQALKRARQIIVPSEWTRQSILKHFPRTKGEKIKVIHEGVKNFSDAAAASEADALNFLKTRQIQKPYLLYVGNAFPHKNLERLIRAFQKVLAIKPGLQLVLAGQDNYFYHRLREETRKMGLEIPDRKSVV